MELPVPLVVGWLVSLPKYVQIRHVWFVTFLLRMDVPLRYWDGTGCHQDRERERQVPNEGVIKIVVDIKNIPIT